MRLLYARWNAWLNIELNTGKKLMYNSMAALRRAFGYGRRAYARVRQPLIFEREARRQRGAGVSHDDQ